MAVDTGANSTGWLTEPVKGQAPASWSKTSQVFVREMS
jgi:hypothetical protein